MLATHRPPSKMSPCEHGYTQASDTHPTSYMSQPVESDDGPCIYLKDSMGFFQDPPMDFSNQATHHPRASCQPASPIVSAWTAPRPTSASLSTTGEESSGVWSASWDLSFSYSQTDSLFQSRPSPALSDAILCSQHSPVSSTYDSYSFSQPDLDSWSKPEPRNESASDEEEDSVWDSQLVAASPRHTTPQGDDSSTSSHRSTARNKSGPTTASKANGSYECNVCGRLFHRRYNRKTHMQTHDPKRQYPNVCRDKACGQRFVRRSDLVRHDRSVHLKQRNHRCTACDAHFARKDTLRRHTEEGCPNRCRLTLPSQARRTLAHDDPQQQQRPLWHMSSLSPWL